MAKDKITASYVFVESGHLQHAGTGWSELRALQYYPYVILYAAALKDSVALEYTALLGPVTELFGKDLREASGDVTDESKQGGTNRSDDSDPGILHWVLAM